MSENWMNKEILKERLAVENRRKVEAKETRTYEEVWWQARKCRCAKDGMWRQGKEEKITLKNGRLRSEAKGWEVHLGTRACQRVWGTMIKFRYVRAEGF